MQNPPDCASSRKRTAHVRRVYPAPHLNQAYGARGTLKTRTTTARFRRGLGICPEKKSLSSELSTLLLSLVHLDGPSFAILFLLRASKFRVLECPRARGCFCGPQNLGQRARTKNWKSALWRAARKPSRARTFCAPFEHISSLFEKEPFSC